MRIKFIGYEKLEVSNHFYVRQEVFIKEQSISKDIEYDIGDINGLKFNFYLNNTIVGVSRIILYKNYIKIQRVAILKKFRKKGYGKLMIQKLESFIKNSFNKPLLLLSSQIDVINFYKNLGYEEYGEVYIDADIVHKNMKKII